jgi:hypothetical protein
MASVKAVLRFRFPDLAGVVQPNSALCGWFPVVGNSSSPEIAVLGNQLTAHFGGAETGV